MKISLCYELVIRDRQGKVLNRVRRRSHSYVRAFLDALYADITQINALLVPDTGGTNRTITAATLILMIGPNDNSNYGPVLGRGSGAVLITDNKLGDQIIHGVVANTLDHQLTEALNLGTTGSTRSFQLRRLFVNSSGASITVNECGSYFLSGGFNFCGIRDLVSPGVPVPNLGTATLIYTIGVTV